MGGKFGFIKWFGHFERRNNKDIVKKTSETRLEENQRKRSPRKKRVGED